MWWPIFGGLLQGGSDGFSKLNACTNTHGLALISHGAKNIIQHHDGTGVELKQSLTGPKRRHVCKARHHGKFHEALDQFYSGREPGVLVVGCVVENGRLQLSVCALQLYQLRGWPGGFLPRGGHCAEIRHVCP